MNDDRLERIFFGAATMWFALLAVAFFVGCILSLLALAAAALT